MKSWNTRWRVVLKDSRDFSLTRECVLGSRLSPQTPAYDLQQACGTGLEAVLLVANKIALGQIDFFRVAVTGWLYGGRRSLAKAQLLEL